MGLRADLSSMNKYERYKLTVDFMRFVATMLAPVMIVSLQILMKKWGLL